MVAAEHPPEHRAWVEGMPDAAAAALTVGQLASWPPAQIWRRLTMLVKLDLRASAYAQVLADRLYPHPDSRLTRGGRPPSDQQLADDLSTARETVRKGRRLLVAHGWLDYPEPPRGAVADYVRLLVPDRVVRRDGVLGEERATRTESRLIHLDLKNSSSGPSKGAAMTEPGEPLVRSTTGLGEVSANPLANSSPPQQSVAMPNPGHEGQVSSKDARVREFARRIESEEEAVARRALWKGDPL